MSAVGFVVSFLFGGFVVIEVVVVLLRMIRLVAPRAQRVGGLRGPHLTEYLIRGELTTFVGLYVTGLVSKA